MLTNRIFLEHELPYSQLESLGISKKNIMAAPPDTLKSFMSGGFTSLLRLQMKSDENTFRFLAKLRLTRDLRGNVELEMLPLYKNTPYDRDLKLNMDEMDMLREGMVIKKNVYNNGKKTTWFAQLDGETNAILKAKAKDIVIPSFVKGVEIDKDQREKLRDGEPVEVIDEDDVYTIGIDLTQPTAVNTIQGDLNDWKQNIAKEWDRMNPGVVGFWLTDENGWQFMQLQDSEMDYLDIQYDYNTNVEIDEDLNPKEVQRTKIQL